MRLLVLDGSRVLTALVARLAPEGVAVESARTFAEANRQLRDHPPEALIVNVSPSALPWKELQAFCSGHEPPIPVLYESCVYHDAAEAGLGQLSPCGHFLKKPYSIHQLRCELEWLVHQAEESCRKAKEAEGTDEAIVH